MSEEKKELFAKINAELIKAMKEKDAFRLGVLRMIKSKILYINARGDMADTEIMKIINKYSKDLKEATEEYTKLGKTAEIGTLQNELKIIQEFLPPEITPEQIKTIVQETITQTAAASIKDMGKVMKEITTKYAGIDAKLVNQFVRELLK